MFLPKYKLEDMEQGRLLFAKGTKFVKSVVKLVDLPDKSVPEIAFVGRSNVGKSSLINAITNISKLARSSNTPGRTRELNYFDVNGHINLVDMPGYGYAKASKTNIRNWNNLVHNYLKWRVNLYCIYVLIDSRHGIKDSDIKFIEMLEELAIIYTIVLTKIVKIKQKYIENIYNKVIDFISTKAAANPYVLKVSTKKNQGIDYLKVSIFKNIENKLWKI